MSSTILLQDTAGSVTVYLELSAGGPATGLTFADVLADLKKEGESSFSAMSLSGSNFIEVGGGTYSITLATTDTDVLGNLYIRVSGATVETTLVLGYVAASAPVNPTTPLSINTTALFGYIVDLQGTPVSGASVSARVLATPAIGSSTEDYIQADTLVTAKSDADGFFTIVLISGAQVDFYIPSAGYRRTLQVPSSSTNVFDIV
jgi:hypothetical protein